MTTVVDPRRRAPRTGILPLVAVLLATGFAGPIEAPQHAVRAVVLPGAPLSIVARPGSHRVTLAWSTAPRDRERHITGYDVRAYAGSRPVGHRFVFGNLSTAVINQLPAGLVHFTVSASNRFGAGPAAQSADVTITGAAPNVVSAWLTTGDHTSLLQPLPSAGITADTGSLPTIYVDPSRQFQQMDGFGASLTDSSAWLIQNKLTTSQRTALLDNLFNPGSGGLSFLRQPIGASDFALGNYTYDDLPNGQTDYAMTHFSIGHDSAYIIPTLQQAVSLNPGLTIMGTPWSPPAWMKSGQSVSGATGGTLVPAADSAYATYLQKFVASYRASGLPVSAITVQNEPLNAPAYPGMVMNALQQAEFIGGFLGPAFHRAGLSTRIVAYDHNWDNPQYAQAVLSNPTADAFVDGSAFHCYAGSPSGQLAAHDAYPAKNIYLTECSGAQKSPSFADDLNWETSELVVDATRDWAKAVATWNVALDPKNGPRFVDGAPDSACMNCRLVTIDPATGNVTYGAQYYVLAQASKAADPGAHRIASNDFGIGWVRNVAFKNPDGSIGMVVLNNAQTPQSFHISTGTRGFDYKDLPANAVVTFRWFPSDDSTQALNRGGWVLSARAPSSRDPMWRAVDGDPSTRWSSGGPQSPGNYVQADMGAASTLTRITLDTGAGAPGDYPRGYAVYVSQDGSDWGRTVATGSGTGELTTISFPPQTARYFRVVQTASSGLWWSIAELNAYP